MDIFQESSLNDSVLFKTFNNNAELSSTIGKCIKTGKVLDSSYIEEQLIQIKKTHLSPFSDDVLDAYEKGEIVLIYSKVVKVPQALPFLVAKQQGKMRAYVFTSNYGTLVANAKTGGSEYLSMTMKDLYVLMEGAYITMKYFYNPIYITRNLGLMKVCNSVYTGMFLRIMNREYALSMNQEIYDRVSFCISKFFLDNIWESKNRDVNISYAMNNILSANRSDLLIVNDQYEMEDITSIDKLLNFLKTLSPRLETLNLRYFTQCWINMYKPGAIFGMETLPYFMYVVEASLLGSFLINQPMITDVMKNIKGVNTYYAELRKNI